MPPELPQHEESREERTAAAERFAVFHRIYGRWILPKPGRQNVGEIVSREPPKVAPVFVMVV